ncbi:MAG: DUF2577 domain-containing protein [Ruminiclostridium sp.]|nr:DUF2577 domain-containing protein [Ruminiclostridium sp.]
MADAAELVKIIKKAATEAVNAEKPVLVCFGKVTEVAPLKILVEQKMTLGAAQLILSRHLTDYECEMTVEDCTENHTATHSHKLDLLLDGDGDIKDGVELKGTAGETELTHCHKITGRKSFIVHNGLAVGDEVILLRQQGGQKFLVWDRIV